MSWIDWKFVLGIGLDEVSERWSDINILYTSYAKSNSGYANPFQAMQIPFQALSVCQPWIAGQQLAATPVCQKFSSSIHCVDLRHWHNCQAGVRTCLALNLLTLISK